MCRDGFSSESILFFESAMTAEMISSWAAGWSQCLARQRASHTGGPIVTGATGDDAHDFVLGYGAGLEAVLGVPSRSSGR